MEKFNFKNYVGDEAKLFITLPHKQGGTWNRELCHIGIDGRLSDYIGVGTWDKEISHEINTHIEGINQWLTWLGKPKVSQYDNWGTWE